MAQIDILEDVVVPESPRTVDNEQLFVYVPVATYDNKGIASFSSDDFVIENGKVMLRVRLSEFEKTLSNKLDKYDKGGKGSILYGVTDDGEQAMFLSDRLPIEDTIAIRDENGNVKTNRPVENNDTINKFYGHNTFANALKGTVSGSAVAMKDVSPLEHELDVKVSSKNLIPYPYAETTKTENGITFTDNGYGTITANGTATNNAVFYMSFETPIKAGKYTLSGCPQGGDWNTYLLALNYTRGDETVGGIRDLGDGAFQEFTEPTTAQTYILILGGATVDNLVFKPQLEKGTVATPYTPYIEDLSTVSVNKIGKNLIPYPHTVTSHTFRGITWTDNGDGTWTANGTATGHSFVKVQTSLIIPKGTYTVSGCPKGGKEWHYWLYAQADSYYPDYGDGHSFTVEEDGTLDIIINVGEGTTVNNLVFKPMLEMNTVATPYEPYIEPTTYTVEADGSVNGVMPLYPSTTLITDNRALIECEYNRDINKAFEELRQIIISLGGNI